MSLTLEQRLRYGERPAVIAPAAMVEVTRCHSDALLVSLHFTDDPLVYAWDEITEAWVRADLMAEAVRLIEWARLERECERAAERAGVRDVERFKAKIRTAVGL